MNMPPTLRSAAWLVTVASAPSIRIGWKMLTRGLVRCSKPRRPMCVDADASTRHQDGWCETSPASSRRSIAPMTSAGQGRGRGYAYALGAYSIWGLIPAYFKLLTRAPPLELMSHRVLWAFFMLIPIAWRLDRLAEVRRALGSPSSRLGLSASTLLIAVNWLVYIWAVFGGRIVEASLGYFLTPLVSVVLGVLVLKERLERAVAVALGMAACGVVWLVVLSGRVPWIAAALALSFGSYGLVRKLVRGVGAVAGLAV